MAVKTVSPEQKSILNALKTSSAAIWVIEYGLHPDGPTYWLKGGVHMPQVDRLIRKSTVNALIKKNLLKYERVNDGIHSGCYTLNQ